jgi:hypothetical protein
MILLVGQRASALAYKKPSVAVAAVGLRRVTPSFLVGYHATKE